MGLTDKQRLYEWICCKTESETKRFCFSEICDEMTTYFQDVVLQPVLEEYYIDGREDIERYMNIYFDEDLSEIRTECIKAILKGIHELLHETAKLQSTERTKGTGIREYIYNF